MKNLWRTPGSNRLTCGTKSPSRSEALRFIDSSKSLCTWGWWGFGWVDKAQCFRSARRFSAAGSSPDFSRGFHDIALLRARSHRREKRAGMKVALPTLTCQAHVTFPPRFIRYFRWKPCQAGTFPPDKTLYRKYRIERGGQKLRTASRSVLLSFLTLSRGKIGDGKKYSSGSRSLEQFFFFWSLQSLVCGIPKVAEHRRSSRVEAPSRFMAGNQWALLLASEREFWSDRRGNLCVREL